MDLNHVPRDFNSTFSCFMSLFKSTCSPLIKKQVSYAYIIAYIRSETLQMALTEIIKRRGTKIDLREIPH